ncbi:NUDIX hydrolase [Macrococcus capreoli]|uniref:NUDIX hydrolase n=1 Tax=Macrococcus capreoli TaxID=2982690 RepID=UPI0021D59B25|nr:NUDIX hydrolase [Macrococcus sp. TMW 2.2395]MCU7556790.1 NUDIX hydrolase [Macrococcus sp. TMW 2.2395]
MDLTERTIHKEAIMNGKVITVEKHRVALPNGKESVREVVLHPGAVAIIAMKDHKLLLVEQFRKAMESSLIELPAGKVEPGEPRCNTALRELEEETGYTSNAMELVSEFYVSPGFCDEFISLYQAGDLIESNTLEADDDEFVIKHWLTLEEANDWIRQGKIKDAKTIIAIQYLSLSKDYC